MNESNWSWGEHFRWREGTERKACRTRERPSPGDKGVGYGEDHDLGGYSEDLGLPPLGYGTP